MIGEEGGDTEVESSFEEVDGDDFTGLMLVRIIQFTSIV